MAAMSTVSSAAASLPGISSVATSPNTSITPPGSGHVTPTMTPRTGSPVVTLSAPPSAASTTPNTAPNPTTPAVSHRTLSRKLRQLWHISAATWIGVAFALGALIAAVYYGEPMLRLARWTALNDFRGSCADYRGTAEHPSERCEALLASPPSPPPVFRRMLVDAKQSIEKQALSWVTMIVIPVVTVIFSTIRLRRYVDNTATPVKSAVRCELGSGAICITRCNAFGQGSAEQETTLCIKRSKDLDHAGPVKEKIERQQHMSGNHEDTLEPLESDDGDDQDSCWIYELGDRETGKGTLEDVATISPEDVATFYSPEDVATFYSPEDLATLYSPEDFAIINSPVRFPPPPTNLNREQRPSAAARHINAWLLDSWRDTSRRILHKITETRMPRILSMPASSTPEIERPYPEVAWVRKTPTSRTPSSYDLTDPFALSDYAPPWDTHLQDQKDRDLRPRLQKLRTLLGARSDNPPVTNRRKGSGGYKWGIAQKGSK